MPVASGSLPWQRERIQSKRVGVAKIAVVESAQESKTRDAVETARGAGYTDNVDRFIEVQGRYPDVHDIDREGTVVRTSQPNRVNVNAAGLKTVILIKDQLERVLSSSRSSICYKPA